MSSTLKKMKKRSNVEFVSGELWTPISNKRYRPYHRNLQRRQFLVHNDDMFVLFEDGNSDLEEIEYGINKRKINIDDDFDIDEYKDGAS